MPIIFAVPARTAPEDKGEAAATAAAVFARNSRRVVGTGWGLDFMASSLSCGLRFHISRKAADLTRFVVVYSIPDTPGAATGL
jgi:hypothetical protein